MVNIVESDDVIFSESISHGNPVKNFTYELFTVVSLKKKNTTTKKSLNRTEMEVTITDHFEGL